MLNDYFYVFILLKELKFNMPISLDFLTNLKYNFYRITTFERRNMNSRKLMYIAIVVMCVIAVVLAIYLQSGKQPSSNRNTTNNVKTEESQEILKKEFDQIFNNVVELNDYDTSNIKKLDSGKNIVYLVDCKSFFNDLASFIQTFVGWTIDAGHSAAQISTKIPNAFIAGMVYWLLLILIVGICMAGTGMLAILIEIKVIELYKKNCWDVITLLMILTSAAVIIYFGEVIKKALSINLLFFWLILQGIYLTIRRYISQDTD